MAANTMVVWDKNPQAIGLIIANTMVVWDKNPQAIGLKYSEISKCLSLTTATPELVGTVPKFD